MASRFLFGNAAAGPFDDPVYNNMEDGTHDDLRGSASGWRQRPVDRGLVGSISHFTRAFPKQVLFVFVGLVAMVLYLVHLRQSRSGPSS